LTCRTEIYSEEVSDQGTGVGDSTVVLIHGLAGASALWDPISQALRPYARVIRYDLRGHGQSASPHGRWTLSDFVADLLCVMDRHDVQKTSLVGFSLGGLIAQRFAIDYPEKLRKLAILSAVAGRTPEEKEKVAERLGNIDAGRYEVNIEDSIQRWFSPRFREEHPALVEKRVALLRAVGREPGYLKAYQVFVTSDLADELYKINAPTLIMTGEHDPGSNTRMAGLMHSQIQGSKIEILPGLRHSILVEAPDLVAEKLKLFLVGN